MTKKNKRAPGGTTSPSDGREQRLQKARNRLDKAEARYEAAKVRAEKHVQAAQIQAGAWLTEAEERLQRRQAALAVLEEESVSGPRLETGPTGEEKAIDASNSQAVTETNGTDPLPDRAVRALQALVALGREGGVTAQEWRKAAAMPGSTFARARDGLLRHGLVRADGDIGKSTRYSTTPYQKETDWPPPR